MGHRAARSRETAMFTIDSDNNIAVCAEVPAAAGNL